MSYLAAGYETTQPIQRDHAQYSAWSARPPSKDRTIRMTALRAFLSLVFITSVLAMAINVVSGLFGE